MINVNRALQRAHGLRLWPAAPIVLVVLLLAFALGQRASVTTLGVLVALMGALALFRYPVLGFPVLILAALAGKMEFSTGTEVNLNPASLLVPALMGIWIANMLQRHEIRLPRSRTTRPLVLFLLFSMISLVVSNALWDPNVPKSDRFIVVQLAQVSLFVFSAGAFWLMGDRVKNPLWLQRITIGYLLVAGGLAIIRILPGGGYVTDAITTFALDRAPFWLVLASLAGGQLFFNAKLSNVWRLFLLGAIIASLYFSFILQQERSSYWVGVGIVLGVLGWLRFPRLRWMAAIVVIALLVSGKLLSLVYEFAGGDSKWTESGASRGVLIGRVLELSMRNPITGIGPAAYRPYGFTRPLFYEGAYWIEPRLNSHNNYVDLFSQLGMIGLLLFFWFMGELLWLGLRLRKYFKNDFASGYVNGMVGMWVGVMAIMALADWFLPFVYNIGFQGFQASVLVWMFFGGLLALEEYVHQMAIPPVTLLATRN